MAIFKCKMCGGTVEFTLGATVGECDSCGTKQTLPRLDDERRVNLYDRANHFRRANEYDKAMGIYETILAEDKTDAEAYWSLVLCRYGVEYVEDPASHKRVPTVNRAQYTSVLADEDYKSALQYADTLQKSIYESEAKAIDDIQKGILEISQKEEPFDVFICYKETDANGRRTPDSVLATELYHELTKAGYKVFFSRITLEDKLGTAYEPYIFAALHSAKVMVVLGTKAEHFNAVWVKNEWSRYLALIQSGEKKTLIPAYKDMDPYDLPEAFSHLQAQDMAKLGFMQDLLHGIQKILGGDTKPAQTPAPVVVQSAPQNANVIALKKRGYMSLEFGDWTKADGFFEEALNQDAEDAECYLGKLMAELHVQKREQLKDAAEPFDGKTNCVMASRFDATISKELADANAYIRERNETARKEKIYQDALSAERSAVKEVDFNKAAGLYAGIPGYKDADKRAAVCRAKAEEYRKEGIYQDAIWDSRDCILIPTLISALKRLEGIPDYKDARTKADECRKKIEELKIKQEKEEAERKERAEAERIVAEKRKKLIKKIAIIGTPIVAALIVFLIVLNSVIIPGSKYKKAVALADAGENQAAYLLLRGIMDYKDSKKKAIAILSKVEVGDFITFGDYEQDNNTSNGREPIKWLVLAKEEGKELIISEYALDCKPFDEYGRSKWEHCSLRSWLNMTFFKDAFNETEQTCILTATVKAEKNPKFDTEPGDDTRDKVFILNIQEYNKYFNSAIEWRHENTDYAAAQKSVGEYGVWLRSPGGEFGTAAFVNGGGNIGWCYSYGNYGDSANGNGGFFVRPAMWIETN